MSTTNAKSIPIEADKSIPIEADKHGSVDPTTGKPPIIDSGEAVTSQHPADAVPESGTSESGPPDAQPHFKKHRRIRWEWNRRLLAISAVATVVVVVACVASYVYQTGRSTNAFLMRAEAAAAEGDQEAEAKWLGRYLMLRPDDHDRLVQMAIAADEAALQASPNMRGAATSKARDVLRRAIAELGTEETHDEQAQDLRRRMILRLLQAGGGWSLEAESQIVTYAADPGDADAVRWLATSLSNQVATGLYQKRDPDRFDRDEAYWQWLASQPPGQVLQLAVESNPADVRLAGELVNLFAQHRDMFRSDRPGNKVSPRASLATSLPDPESQVKQVAAELASRNADGEAFWIAHQFYRTQSEAEQADQILSRAAAWASQELLTLAEQTDDETTAISESESSVDVVHDYRDRRPRSFWPFILLLEAADRAVATDPEQAERWFDQLIASDTDDIPEGVTERTFQTAGNLQLQQGDYESACRIWKDGVDRLGTDRVGLLQSIAMTMVNADESDLEPTRQSVEQLRRGVDQEAVRLARISTQLSAEQREATRRGLDTAEWVLELLEGTLARRGGNTDHAIAKLDAAFRSKARVAEELRVNVARELAGVYAAQGVWDRAAQILDEASSLVPSDVSISVAAAEAWSNSQNPGKARRHWERASGSPSFLARVAAAEVAFTEQAQMLPAERRLDRVVQKIAAANALIASADGSPALAQEISENRWRLQLLEAALQVGGQDLGARDRSEYLARKVVEIAAQDPDIEELQATAAVRLAAVGMTEESDVAMERLKSLTGDDSIVVALTNVRILAVRGRVQEAYDHLLLTADRHPERMVELRRLASELAQSRGDRDAAYRALEAIPDSEKTVDVLEQLAMIARTLGPESEFLTRADAANLTVSELAERWEQKLREVEGSQGTRWRYAVATRLLTEVIADRKGIASSDPRVVEIRQHVQQLLRQRPQWGPAISLGGWLRAVDGDLNASIDHLRRGIDAGDRLRINRQLLAEQLNRAGRYEDAMRELQSIDRMTGTIAAGTSPLAVSIAQQQGEFGTAVEMARQATTQRPQDSAAWLVLAQAGFIASGQSKQDEEREALVSETREAFRKAAELTEGTNEALLRSRFAFELLHGDEATQQAVSEEIGQNRLEEPRRSLLIAQTHWARGNIEEADKHFKRAEKSAPQSLEVQYAIAKFYGATKRQDGVIDALQKAYEINPGVAKIRNDLAASLAMAGEGDVPWDRIEELLGEDSGGSENNRLNYALMLSVKGGEQQQSQGRQLLRELIDSNGAESANAARVLAALLSRDWAIENASDSSSASQLLADAKKSYEFLLRQDEPALVDFYRYSILMLAAGDRDRADQLREKMIALFGPTQQSLNLALQLNAASENLRPVSELIDAWVHAVRPLGELKESQILGVAGRASAQYGDLPSAIRWLGQAYQEDPVNFADYVVTLIRGQQPNIAVDVCLDRYQHSPSADVVTLLAEAIMSIDNGQQTLDDQVLSVLNEGTNRFPTNVALLESVATVQLQQQNHREAMRLYELVQKLGPGRVRTLNNLAMAYAGIPGRAAEGLELVEQALEIVPDNPELLDTKGFVLLRAGQLAEARATFEKALELLDEPRFRFHLIITLRAAGDADAAQEHWQQLDQSALDPRGLTPEEREQLRLLRKEYDGTPVSWHFPWHLVPSELQPIFPSDHV